MVRIRRKLDSEGLEGWKMRCRGEEIRKRGWPVVATGEDGRRRTRRYWAWRKKWGFPEESADFSDRDVFDVLFHLIGMVKAGVGADEMAQSE